MDGPVKYWTKSGMKYKRLRYYGNMAQRMHHMGREDKQYLNFTFNLLDLRKICENLEVNYTIEY